AWIDSNWPMLVPVPEPLDQRHQQITVNSMPLLDCVVLQFGRPRHVDDIAQRLLPALGKRRLVGETLRRQRLRRRKRRSTQRTRRARGLCGFQKKVSSVDVVAHRYLLSIE